MQIPSALIAGLMLVAAPALADVAPEKAPETTAAQKPQKKPVTKQTKAAELKSKRQRVGYAVGFNTAYGLKRNFDSQTIDVDIESVKRGFADALANATPALSEQEIRTILAELQKDLEVKRKENMAKEQEKLRVQGEKNRKEGEAFLKDNAAKEGVKVLPSGLQYRILSEGSGKKAAPTDTVTVNYRGTLINGTEFDSSSKQGKPVTFPLNQVIKGWTEGLQLIKEGGKIQLFIPSDLAYGKGGGGMIGPHSTLIFDVELISVQTAAGAVTSGPAATAR